MTLNIMASFGEVMGYIGYVLIAVLVLLVMITVHEFGHYITGKIFKFDIKEFAIGFGPKLFSKKKKNGEIFSLRLLPLGGFCAFSGEDEESQLPNAFNNKKPWQRIIVLISGALMNYIFALLIIAVTFFSFGQPGLVTYDVDDSPVVSQEYCFNDKDVIISANGNSVYMITDLMKAVQNRQVGDRLPFIVRRGGVDTLVMIELRADTNFINIEDYEKLYTALGIHYELDQMGNMTKGGLYSTSIKTGFFQTIGNSFDYSFKLAGSIFTVIGQLFTGALGLKSMGGTITTISMTANAIKVGGLRYLLNITSLIGVNLAVFNLLPIPALDGSRVLFTGIEWIRKKPLNRRVEAIIHGVGLLLLFAFAILVDLQQCF